VPRSLIGSLLALGTALVLLTASTAFGAHGRAEEGFRFRARASGLTAKVLLYIDRRSTARTVVVGLNRDADGRPGPLLSTGSLSAPHRGAWNTVSLAPSRVVTGRTYWLTVLGRGGTLRRRNHRRGRCASAASVQAHLTELPFSGSTGRVRAHPACPVSAYVILETTLAPSSTTSPFSSTFPTNPTTALTQTLPVSPTSLEAPTPLEETTLPKETAPPEETTPPKETPKEPKEEPTEEPTEPPPPPAAPVNTALPTIRGTTTEGQILTTTDGTWEGTPTSYEYQWQDCDTLGESCADIPDATASNYELGAGDVGDTLRVVVTATNTGGSTQASSAATTEVEEEPIEPPPPSPPVDKTPPTISGATTQGHTLTATTGTWEGDPTSYTYKWQDCSESGATCTPIPDATTAKYALTATDVKHTLRVVVTATNEGGSTPATSAHTATIAPTPPPPAPTNTSPPLVSGTTTESQTLTTTNGTWEGTPTSYKYQWQDCNTLGEDCRDISGAAAFKYTLTALDVGETLRATVTATNAGGSTPATSAKTAVVTGGSTSEEDLFMAPTGSDSNPCTEAKPCLTMGHTYQKATSGQTVRLLAGSYPEQHIAGGSSKTSSHVVFAPASGASVRVTGTIYVLGSHLTIENLAVQDITIGNYDQEPGAPNPTDVTLLNLTGRNFEIDSATHITVEGGSWGPASACGGPYGGDNNSIRQPIAGVAPEDILIDDTVIHDVQSYNLSECHIEGLAIFAGNHVTVSSSKFYENSVYDVFMQANSGGSPNNITLKGNWFATAVDNSGANGQPVGSGDGVAVGNELSANVTLEGNHFNDVLNMDDAEEISKFSNVHVLDNVGVQPYSGYDCGGLSGVEWSRNIWQNDKCGATDVDLEGAALPYVNTANNSTLDYELTGKYADWPEETGSSAGTHP
jgi:hypothetical protein